MSLTVPATASTADSPSRRRASTFFTYNDRNRITSGHGQNFTWESRGVLDALNGQDFAPDPLHSHAVEKLDGVRRYVYDRNGSMTVRNLGLAGWEQTLKWDSHNRLAQVTGAGVSESYLYDENGIRLRKTNLLPPYTSTDYLFPGYERTDGGVVTKHYSFNDVPMAVRTGGNEPTLLYQDGVGSTVYTTNVWGTVTSARGYYAFGATRFSEGTMPTDRHFTSQREDGTGLLYYGARYYDPLIGQFISPDTIVPDPTQVIDYNRYLYARGNPVKFNDPSGHCATHSNGQPDENDQECWQYAYTIWAQWDNTDYWQKMWPEGKDHFIKSIATQSIEASFFKAQVMKYIESDEYAAWNNAHRIADPMLDPAESVDGVDAIAVGFSYNPTVPLLEILGLGGTVGGELVATKKGELGILPYAGGGLAIGFGSSVKLYITQIYSLRSLDDYTGGSASVDLTVSVGPAGFNYGEFTSPGGTHGRSFGFAPGGKLAVSAGGSYYFSPLWSR